MSDLIKRLRDQGKDAFSRQYSLGMFKLCAEAADEIEKLARRVTVLETVIAEDLRAADCSDELNEMIVVEIHERHHGECFS